MSKQLRYEERLFLEKLQAVGIPTPNLSYLFDPLYKWRFDFAWRDRGAAVDFLGDESIDAKRHNAATLAGWLVYYIPRHWYQGPSGEVNVVVDRVRSLLTMARVSAPARRLSLKEEANEVAKRLRTEYGIEATGVHRGAEAAAQRAFTRDPMHDGEWDAKADGDAADNLTGPRHRNGPASATVSRRRAL